MFTRGELYQYPGTRTVSTFAASAHFLTCPVMSSGSGSHQTPVAVWDFVMDSKSGPALIGPILIRGVQCSAPLIYEVDQASLV